MCSKEDGSLAVGSAVKCRKAIFAYAAKRKSSSCTLYVCWNRVKKKKKKKKKEILILKVWFYANSVKLRQSPTHENYLSTVISLEHWPWTLIRWDKNDLQVHQTMSSIKTIAMQDRQTEGWMAGQTDKSKPDEHDWLHSLFVGWLLNVPATCEFISGMDLLRQFYVLPHWDRSCRSNFLLHPVTVYWHRADQSQRWPCNARRLAG